MKQHRLTLLGGTRGELRVPASIIQEAIAALIEGARTATRFVVDGESVRKGPRPAWLDAASAIDITSLSAGSAVLALDAPTLREADDVRFGEGAQISLFEEQGPKLGEQTVIDVFGTVLAAIVEGPTEEVVADRALLESCLRFARVPGQRFTGLQLDGLRGRDGPLVIRPEHVSRIELLRDETPPAQAVRISGTLDTISASRSDVLLTLADGHRVPARFEEYDLETVKQLVGAEVVISGMAHFRPSGKLLLVHAESLARARDTDRIFAAVPATRRRAPVFTPVPQDAASGVSAFFGTWPGDETEGELLEALQALG